MKEVVIIALQSIMTEIQRLDQAILGFHIRIRTWAQKPRMAFRR